MSNIARIALQNGTPPANTNGIWNSFSADVLTPEALLFSDGSASGWTFEGLRYHSVDNPTTAGSGDAAWVDEAVIASEGWATSTGGSEGIVRSAKVTVDDADASYNIKVFCWRGDTSRETGIAVNTEPKQIVSANDMTEVASFSGIAPNASSQLEIFYSEENSLNFGYIGAIEVEKVGSAPTLRKSSTFEIETTLGTITTATLNAVNVFDHVTGQVGTTVSFAGAATDEITTSGEYTLTLGDGATTEDIAVQVNVYGVVPSNNPFQKDGSALASLSNVQYRVTAGTSLDGTQLDYTGTGALDASGNIPTFDVSDTAAVVDDDVLIHALTATGESIIAPETVELI